MKVSFVQQSGIKYGSVSAPKKGEYKMEDSSNLQLHLSSFISVMINSS